MNKVEPKRLGDPLNNEHGAVAAMTAIFLIVLLAVAAAAIDVGHALVARNELQNTADAAALAGTTLREAGLPFSLVVKPSLRRRDLVGYANAHEHIAAVVIDSREGWEALAQDRSSDPWKHLACPLVTAAAQDKKPH